MEQELTYKDYLRPLKLAIFFSVLGEAAIFLIWGMLLFPEGNLIHKFLWTVIFCGLGMGATVGAIIALFVVGRWKGLQAIVLCAELSGIVLGLFCNYLCYNLDMHFGYFGGKEVPLLFVINGMVLAILGGSLVGWFCFSEKGKRILNKYNI
ncbi:hypothetical protein [Flagellimonas pacifica]|uniref:Uncharacterized protein n=1 Tax=Flagellimonas pacifica TaxID=1247520 RepID=A0A285N041_9FLAO|nr:hypothetical protein [Allomuricauda parva]SNZ01396.1 hypothetical protein SAMN06265377_3234 [Allomuricauda parva]